MKVQFLDNSLEELFYEGKWARDYPEQVVKKFVMIVHYIILANSIKDLYLSQFSNFEKLAWSLQWKYSMRLNKQYRLILVVIGSWDSTAVRIEKISKHYE